MSLSILKFGMAFLSFFRTVTGIVTLRTDLTTLTTSYVYSSDAGNAPAEVCVLVGGLNRVVVNFHYVKGSEVTVNIQARKSHDGGVTWYNFPFKATQASGVSAVTYDVLELTPANYGADAKFSLYLDISGVELLDIGVKYISGSAPGSLGITVNGCSIAPVN